MKSTRINHLDSKQVWLSVMFPSLTDGLRDNFSDLHTTDDASCKHATIIDERLNYSHPSTKKTRRRRRKEEEKEKARGDFAIEGTDDGGQCTTCMKQTADAHQNLFFLPGAFLPAMLCPPFLPFPYPSSAHFGAVSHS